MAKKQLWLPGYCDNCYKELCDVITKEMDRHLHYFTSNTNNIREKLKVTKPYWNEKLTNMFH